MSKKFASTKSSNNNPHSLNKEEHTEMKPMSPLNLHWKLISKAGRARHGILQLRLGRQVHTPVFMPVGTQGTMKGLTSDELAEELALGAEILLCNTFHLGHRPGYELVRQIGGTEGIHSFMRWPRAILTDSGGFQMVSLSKLMHVEEDGVHFESPHTGEPLLLTPEHCMEIQEALGADIAMQLDHVIPSLTEGPLVEEAMWRSIRWLDRCVAAQTRQEDQALFPIIQGGLDLELRKRCTEEMVKRARVGIAIGGLSGGEAKDQFWRIVAHCCELIPPQLPRYVMGVGWPIDLVVASLLGADMFDCVYPTRTARFGTAMTRREGELHLPRERFKSDHRPIDVECECSTCKNGYPRSFFYENISRETVACHLLTVHNLHHQLDLMRRLRAAIDADDVQTFLTEFLDEQFGRQGVEVPEWVKNALTYAGYNVEPTAAVKNEKRE